MERCSGGGLRAEILTTTQLFADAISFTTIAIDIPIGLARNGNRMCDKRARTLLGAPRSGSVFSAPPRDVLRANSYVDACDRSFAVCGKRISRQVFGILAKIRDVDAELQKAAPLIARVHEVHPEVSFAVMAGGEPMRHSDADRRLRSLQDVGAIPMVEMLARRLQGASSRGFST